MISLVLPLTEFGLMLQPPAPGAPRALCVLRGQAAWPGPAGAVLVASQSVTCESIGYTAEAYHLAGINTC